MGYMSSMRAYMPAENEQEDPATVVAQLAPCELGEIAED